MSYQILYVQGAGEVTIAEEQIIVDHLKMGLGDNFQIVFPHMPDADHPAYVAWEQVITSNLDSLSGKVILLGHSLGASIILKHFSKHPLPDKVLGMILFGVPYWKDQNWDVSEYEIDQAGRNNLCTLENMIMYYSPDDEVIPAEQFEAYRRLLPKAIFREFPGMDHSYHGAADHMIKDILYLASDPER